MATKFLVMVLVIGFACANVSARPLEKTSEELKDEKIMVLGGLGLGGLVPVITGTIPGLPAPVVEVLTSSHPPTLPVPISGNVETGGANSATKLITNVGTKGSEVSKETKSRVSIPGTGAQLSVVTSDTSAYGSGYSSSNAAEGPGGSSGNSYASGDGSTSGSVRAESEGPTADAYSSSGASGQGITDASAGPSGATSSGNGYGDGSSYSYGNAGP